MLGLTKYQIAAAYANNVSDRQLADYITETVSLAQSKSRNFAIANDDAELRGYRAFSDEIEKVHSRLSDDIRSRYDGELITTEQFTDVMLKPLVMEELENALPVDRIIQFSILTDSKAF